MKSSSALEALPLDTLSYALSFLSDKASLRAALISCPALYNAFKHRKAYIASSVLFQSMNEGLYQEAVVAFNLKQETWKGAKACVEAINRVFGKERTIAAQRLTFPKVQSMWRLHKSIEYLTKEIIPSIKTEHHVKHFIAFQPTAAGISRIQRAFYRLDMYLTIMATTEGSWLDDNGGENRSLTDDEEEEAHWAHCLAGLEKHRVKKAFCSNFSIVEIEQLMCIRDMLMVHVAPVYNDFVEHDIAMGIYMPSYIRDTVGPAARALISPGLNFIFDFMTAPTPVKLSRVAKEGLHLSPRTTSVFQLSPLEIDEQLTVDAHQVSDKDFKQGFAHYHDQVRRKAFYDDSDAGLEWAFGTFGPAHKVARLGGFVFWNFDKLSPAFADFKEDLGLFFYTRVVFDDRDPFRKWTDEAEELLHCSFDARMSLQQQGKSGYFDFETFELTHEGSTSWDDEDDDDDDDDDDGKDEDEDENEDEDESTDNSVAYSEEE